MKGQSASTSGAAGYFQNTNAGGKSLVATTSAGADALTVLASGNVGIGTAAPTQKLDVAGNILTSGSLITGGYTMNVGANLAGKVLTSDLNGNATWQTPAGGLSGSGTASRVAKFTAANTLGDSSIFDDGTNVGIGTTGPLMKLEVNSASGGAAIHGKHTAASGVTFGVWGLSNSLDPDASGIRGDGKVGVWGSGVTGVYGTSDATSAKGVHGRATTGSGVTYGGFFESQSSNFARGVFGVATSTVAGIGVHGRAGGGGDTILVFEDRVGVFGESTNGKGVYGRASGVDAPTYGVFGEGGTGVYGTGGTYGVRGQSSSSTGFGGHFNNSNASGKALVATTSAGADALTVLAGGNVGIGIGAPTAKLHIAGTAGVDGIRFPDGTLQTTAAAGGGTASDVNCGAPCVASSEIVDDTITNGDINVSAAISPGKIAGTAAVLGSNTFSGGQIVNVSDGVLTPSGGSGALYAYNTDTSAPGNFGAIVGVYAKSDNGPGVIGEGASGGSFVTTSSIGVAVYGSAPLSSGNSIGGSFSSGSSSGKGILAQAGATSGSTIAGHFFNASTSGIAVFADSFGATGATYGGKFQAASANGFGGWFQNSEAGGNGKALVAADHLGNEALTIKGNGNVGVGTAAPAVKLDVWGADPFSGTFLNGSGPTSGTADLMSTDTAIAADRGPILALGGYRASGGTDPGVFAGIRGAKENAVDGNRDGYLAIYTTQTGVAFAERMRVTSSGNVGIGTATPVSRLTVNSGANTNIGDMGCVGTFGGIAFVNTPGPCTNYNLLGSATTLYLNRPSGGEIRFRENNGDQMIIAAGGNVGIGTTAPTQKLSVNGDANKVGGGSWLVFSDARLKNVAGPFQGGLREVLQLNPVRFRYKDDNALGIGNQKEHIGFVAQEVEKVIPEAVTMGAEGYRSLNNDPILWTMLNAIKEQQGQIASQQAENAALRATVESQQQRVERLERLIEQRLGAQVSKAVSGQ